MPDEVSEAIARLWQELPVGTGKDFNKVVKYIEHINHMLYPYS